MFLDSTNKICILDGEKNKNNAIWIIPVCVVSVVSLGIGVGILGWYIYQQKQRRKNKIAKTASFENNYYMDSETIQKFLNGEAGQPVIALQTDQEYYAAQKIVNENGKHTYITPKAKILTTTTTTTTTATTIFHLPDNMDSNFIYKDDHIAVDRVSYKNGNNKSKSTDETKKQLATEYLEIEKVKEPGLSIEEYSNVALQ
eukprot:Pgem_evm2s1395